MERGKHSFGHCNWDVPSGKRLQTRRKRGQPKNTFNQSVAERREKKPLQRANVALETSWLWRGGKNSGNSSSNSWETDFPQHKKGSSTHGSDAQPGNQCGVHCHARSGTPSVLPGLQWAQLPHPSTGAHLSLSGYGGQGVRSLKSSQKIATLHSCAGMWIGLYTVGSEMGEAQDAYVGGGKGCEWICKWYLYTEFCSRSFSAPDHAQGQNGCCTNHRVSIMSTFPQKH